MRCPVCNQGWIKPAVPWTVPDYGLPKDAAIPPFSEYLSPPGTCAVLRDLYHQILPELVVEFGAGVSTVVFSDLIANDPREVKPMLLSVEDDPETAAAIGSMAPLAKFIVSPIAPMYGLGLQPAFTLPLSLLLHAWLDGPRTDWPRTDWYRLAVLIGQIPTECKKDRVRLLAFVDGPSTPLSGPRGRGPALPVVEYLWPDWTGAVILDDVQRLGEALDFIDWARLLPKATVEQIPVSYLESDPLYVKMKRLGVLSFLEERGE